MSTPSTYRIHVQPVAEAVDPEERRAVDAAHNRSRPRRWVEPLLVLSTLTLLAAFVYGDHVRDGGFIMDDWSNAAKTRYLAACCGTGQTGDGFGYVAQVRNLFSDGPAGHHIGLPLLIPLTFFVFGPALSPHLALAVGLAVLVSAAMYAVLRHFGVAPVHALAMAALVLVFPWSDANRLWAMASYNQLAVVLWLVGLLVAVRGLRRSAAHAVSSHALALVLYAAAIAIYELIAGPVLATAAFYWHRDVRGRVAWKGVAARWAADVAVTAATLLAVLALALPRFIVPWEQQLAFAGVVADESVTLLAFAAVPFAQPPRVLVAAVLALVLLCAGVVRARLPADEPVRVELGRWLLVAAAGVLVLGAGYAMAVPGGYGRPLAAGLENRVNLVSSAGYVLLVYAALAAAALLIVRATRVPPTWASALPVAAALLVGAGYVPLALDSAKRYDRSFTTQLRVLHAIRDGGPFPSGANIFAFGYPSFTAVGVPVFAWIWDLAPASKVILDDPSPAAFPVLPGTTFLCDEESVTPVNTHGLFEFHRTRYGSAFFVDVSTGRTERLDDVAECEAAIARFRPGPLVEGRECSFIGAGAATRLEWSCDDGPPPLTRP